MTLHLQQKNGLVYSTEQGRVCSRCARPLTSCSCTRERRQAGDGAIRVQREVKGRRGKTVTTVTGIPGSDEVLRKLARHLKSRCGSGGSSKNGVIIIQGDHRDMIISELNGLGYTAKRSGG